ncbi:MAG: hypothetical protein M1833_005187 [Piccolia ochrophora]|nr:MAG: hypothetical protein M1833_005187 [Piccolia ochrophora]
MYFSLFLFCFIVFRQCEAVRGPFAVTLGLDGLRAQFEKIEEPPALDRPTNFNWQDVAKRVRTDAKELERRSTKTRPYYDVWPTLSNLIKFEVELYELAEHPKPISPALLRGFANAFRAIDKQGRERNQFQCDGRVTDDDGHVYFTFRIYKVLYDCARSEFSHPLNEADTANLQLGRKTILDQVSEKDRVIFMGNTASYFYWAVAGDSNRPRSRQNWPQIRLVPFSGRPADPDGWVSEHKDAPYFQTYVSSVLEPAFEGDYDRVVLVDNSYEGYGLRTFVGMLRVSGVYTGTLAFINILSAGTEALALAHKMPGLDYLDPIRLQGETSGPDEVSLIFRNGHIGRLLPPYPWLYWHLPLERIEYPDKFFSQDIIDRIRSNKPYSRIEGLVSGMKMLSMQNAWKGV